MFFQAVQIFESLFRVTRALEILFQLCALVEFKVTSMTGWTAVLALVTTSSAKTNAVEMGKNHSVCAAHTDVLKLDPTMLTTSRCVDLFQNAIRCSLFFFEQSKAPFRKLILEQKR